MRRVNKTVVGTVIALMVGATVATAQQAATGGTGAEFAGGVVARATPAMPAPWLQGDPADSVYKAARSALNRSQYRQAIELFTRLRKQYPASGYVGDAYYWQAFAYYRLGAMQDLREALKLIDVQAERFPQAGTRSEAEVLATRIRGRLAQRGDAEAAEQLAVEGGIMSRQGAQRDAEAEVRMAALQALMMMESEQAAPLLREIVMKRDPGSVELRQRAIVVLGQQRDPENEALLLDVVRNDPDPEVRTMALMFLAESSSDGAYEVLAEAARTSDDLDMRRRAVMLIAQRRDERSLEFVREIVREPGADPEMRQMAAMMLGQSRRPEDRAFLREMYGTTDDRDLKAFILHSMADSKRPEDRQWLLDRARDVNEDPEVRQQALFFAAQDNAVPIATIVEIYDSVEDPDMRAHLLYALSHRKEPAAVDKLMEVASSDPNPEVRQQAVIWLGQSKDPRVAQFLIDLISK